MDETTDGSQKKVDTFQVSFWKLLAGIICALIATGGAILSAYVGVQIPCVTSPAEVPFSPQD